MPSSLSWCRWGDGGSEWFRTAPSLQAAQSGGESEFTSLDPNHHPSASGHICSAVVMVTPLTPSGPWQHIVHSSPGPRGAHSPSYQRRNLETDHCGPCIPLMGVFVDGQAWKWVPVYLCTYICRCMTVCVHRCENVYIYMHVVHSDLCVLTFGDCSNEIRRRLLFARKALTNLDSILKSKDITSLC